jgi:hypothetical protein
MVVEPEKPPKFFKNGVEITISELNQTFKSLIFEEEVFE